MKKLLLKIIFTAICFSIFSINKAEAVLPGLWDKKTAEEYLTILSDAWQHGLDLEDYNYASLKSGLQSNVNISEMSADLTASYLKYGSHLHGGKLKYNQTGNSWNTYYQKENIDTILLNFLNSGNIGSIKNLPPVYKGYEELRKAMIHYRSIEQNGGLPEISAGKVLKKGMTNDKVKLLREYLLKTGDLAFSPADTASPAVFDEILEAAVMNFQKRHGITPDGTVGKQVYAALNISLSHRINQIALNMERYRWLPRRMDEPYVFVNIPGYNLSVMDNENKVLEMNVVTGKVIHSTPIFDDEIELVVFSPYWNIPSSIIQNEILPALQKDPNYLVKNNMESRRDKRGNLSVRQRPGRGNALGKVKFLFPNEFDIYLHDTPAKSLFNKDERAFSHGCVRVQQPFELAKYLLNDNPLWDDESIKGAMNSGKEKYVRLNNSVPVFIYYLTAWGENEVVHFRKDIYKHDQRQLKLF